MKLNSFAPSPYTVLAWQVKDLESAAEKLKKNKVKIKKFSHIKQTSRGIWTSPEKSKVIWFKDPEGNLLSFISSPLKKSRKRA
ncbi:MAG: hypothetical protein B7Y39_12560 [Bdellovibrio sp. 28-41-41]|nr:MAG: hypothetical protein B7Y39_12560 [Bdellovibrio sp. 28-41-41]